MPPNPISGVPKDQVGNVVQQFVNAGSNQVSVQKESPPATTYTVTPQ